MRRVDVLTSPGTVVDAVYPAPVAAGNVETSQRIVDVLLGALASALPDRIPAASAGTMSNLTFGGRRSGGRPFAYYETLAGGAGGGPAGTVMDLLPSRVANPRARRYCTNSWTYDDAIFGCCGSLVVGSL